MYVSTMISSYLRRHKPCRRLGSASGESAHARSRDKVKILLPPRVEKCHATGLYNDVKKPYLNLITC
jgi:hypothetical protein